jgi:hypothetical protein
MLDTIAKNAAATKSRPAQRTGLERRALQWVRRFADAKLVECDGQLWITDNYRLHAVPAEYAAVLGLARGAVTSTSLNANAEAITIDQSAQIPGADVVRNLVNITSDACELIPQDTQQADGIARFTLNDGTVLLAAKYLADAAADGAVRLSGVARLKPVHALDANGNLVAVIMPRSRE